MELKAERYIAKIAWNYIPEDRKDDFVMAWPCAQINWSGSSPSPRTYHLLPHSTMAEDVEGLGIEGENSSPEPDSDL
jgi:hypothetical protein